MNIFCGALIYLHLSAASIKKPYFQVTSYFSFEAEDLVISPSTSREEFLIKFNGIVDEHYINSRALAA